MCHWSLRALCGRRSGRRNSIKAVAQLLLHYFEERKLRQEIEASASWYLLCKRFFLVREKAQVSRFSTLKIWGKKGNHLGGVCYMLCVLPKLHEYLTRPHIDHGWGPFLHRWGGFFFNWNKKVLSKLISPILLCWMIMIRWTDLWSILWPSMSSYTHFELSSSTLLSR